jgi:hypothetical protein
VPTLDLIPPIPRPTITRAIPNIEVPTVPMLDGKSPQMIGTADKVRQIIAIKYNVPKTRIVLYFPQYESAKYPQEEDSSKPKIESRD